MKSGMSQLKKYASEAFNFQSFFQFSTVFFCLYAYIYIYIYISYTITYPYPDELLNRRSELGTKCRHENKFLSKKTLVVIIEVLNHMIT